MLTYGHIIDPTTEEVVDEVMVVYMNAPRTYTCENVVEIQGHGGPLYYSGHVAVSATTGRTPGESGRVYLACLPEWATLTLRRQKR